jgi:hypothetical protein
VLELQTGDCCLKVGCFANSTNNSEGEILEEHALSVGSLKESVVIVV